MCTSVRRPYWEKRRSRSSDLTRKFRSQIKKKSEQKLHKNALTGLTLSREVRFSRKVSSSLVLNTTTLSLLPGERKEKHAIRVIMGCLTPRYLRSFRSLVSPLTIDPNLARAAIFGKWGFFALLPRSHFPRRANITQISSVWIFLLPLWTLILHFLWD